MNYQVMPDLSTEEYAELKADIASRGVMVPIEYDEQGNVLDGHHRLKICAELGLKDYPKVIRAGMNEKEKREHARKLNIARRHLTQEQRRGLIREQLTETPQRSDRQIAAGLGVHHTTVSTQRRELETGGEISHLKTRLGADGKEYPREAQRKPIAIFNPKPSEEKAIQNPAVIEKLEQGAANLAAAVRETRREEIKTAPPKQLNGKYDVIYADPPWEYEFSETENRAIANHYPTMKLEEIKNIKAPCEDNAALFLWATAPKLEEALSVINAWGFNYRTCAVWDKEKIGMGYWFRNQHELLLIGVRGKFSAPQPQDRASSVYREARTQHSKKPDYFYGLIEKMFPNGKYLELFARRRYSENWEVWGNMIE